MLPHHLLILPLFAAATRAASVTTTAGGVGSAITNLNELFDHFFDQDGANAVMSVGFLSEANYHAVASALPPRDTNGGPLAVRIFEHGDDLEAAVRSGELIAGLRSANPENRSDFHTFGAGIITMRSAMTAPANIEMRQLLDAAIVRAADDGTWQQIENQYYTSNGFDSVSAWTCPATPDKFPFPDTVPATIRMGMLGTSSGGPPDWGYQGTYANETGMWPDVERAIIAAIPGDVALERIYFNTSDAVMDALLAGDVDTTAPYWTVGGFYNGQIRHASAQLGCTVLGTESVFFTKRAVAGVREEAEGKKSTSSNPLAIGLSLGGLGVIVLVAVVLVVCETRGTPVFKALVSE